MNTCLPSDFLAPRRCLREPIREHWEVVGLLEGAAEAHLAGDRGRADRLLREADKPAVRAWTESLWGSAKANPDQWRYLRLRDVASLPDYLPKQGRVARRQPSIAEKAAIFAHYGNHCVFCGLPLIRSAVRMAFHRLYPDAVPWGAGNLSEHAAFQGLWCQFDHVVPHCRGGDNSLYNVVVTCAGCNYGRGDRMLEEVGVIDPRPMHVRKPGWDGLERILGVRRAVAG